MLTQTTRDGRLVWTDTRYDPEFGGDPELLAHELNIDPLPGQVQTMPDKQYWVWPSSWGNDPGDDDAGPINQALQTFSQGVVRLVPWASYNIQSEILGSVGQYVRGAGMNSTYLNYSGTGDCLRWTYGGSYSGLTTIGGGAIGLTVDGTSAGAGSAGVHAGDIESLRFRDVYVRNFTGAGSIGFHFDNTQTQTERLSGEIHATNCTNAVVFDVSGALTSTISFARPDLVVYYTASTVAQNGVVVQNGANLYDMVRLAIFGNHASSATGSPGATLVVTGTCPAGHPAAGQGSKITHGNMTIGVETGSGAVTPLTISFGSSSNQILDTSGQLDWSQGSQAFTGSNLATAGAGFRHFGLINGDASLVSTFYSGTNAIAGFTTGSEIFPSLGGNQSVNPTGAATGCKIATTTTDGQQLTVVNLSANTVTFAASGTSNVAGGTGATIPGDTNRLFIWNAATSLWYGGL